MLCYVEITIFFTDGKMRDSVYQTVPTTLEELAGRVEHFFQNLDHHVIQNTFDNFNKRCVMC